jgi:pimeloyl-ACP methyl ester carboxylesterase
MMSLFLMLQSDGMNKRLTHWLPMAVAAALGLSTLSGCAGKASSAGRETGNPEDLRAVLPDHRVLSFQCAGQGSPTVLLEAGFGAGANAWWAVQPLISPRTRVCAYSRAGYGGSDPGPMPRDGAAIARDLDFGLKAARIEGPFVLVGHSAGGLYARLFAARRPRDVVGLVFVDSSVEHQTQRFQAVFGPNAGSLDGVRRHAARCLEATLAPMAPESEAILLDCAPPKLDAAARRVALRPDTWRTQVSELDTLFTTTSDEVDRTGDLLKDIPAIVLTAAKADGVAATADDPGALVWQQFHQRLAARFLKGAQRPVRSSHLMMNDRPQVVADAALDLVQRARGR